MEPTAEEAGVGGDMSEDPQGFLLQVVFVLICTLGGFRFRRWAVTGRSRVPRFSQTVETIVCWGVYGAFVSFSCSGEVTGSSSTNKFRSSSTPYRRGLA